MNYISDIFKNEILQTAVLSWFVAQMIKILLTLFKEKRLDFTRLFGSGGMPSSHASFTVSLAVSVTLIIPFFAILLTSVPSPE